MDLQLLPLESWPLLLASLATLLSGIFHFLGSLIFSYDLLSSVFVFVFAVGCGTDLL